MPSESAFPSGKGSGIALGEKLYYLVKTQDFWLGSGCCGCKVEFPLDRTCLNLSLILFKNQTD